MTETDPDDAQAPFADTPPHGLPIPADDASPGVGRLTLSFAIAGAGVGLLAGILVGLLVGTFTLAVADEGGSNGALAFTTFIGALGGIGAGALLGSVSGLVAGAVTRALHGRAGEHAIAGSAAAAAALVAAALVALLSGPAVLSGLIALVVGYAVVLHALRGSGPEPRESPSAEQATSLQP